MCQFEYFEETTGVKFPSNTKTLHCFDNLEYLTINVRQIQKEEIEKFILRYRFEKLESEIELLGEQWLDTAYHIPVEGHYHELTGENGKSQWRYVIDRTTGKTWSQIIYPDWGGK